MLPEIRRVTTEMTSPLLAYSAERMAAREKHAHKFEVRHQTEAKFAQEGCLSEFDAFSEAFRREPFPE